MGSLSNLYISQSYQSLLHFGTDSSASANLTMLQDGVGQNLYTYVNTNGDLLTSHSISSSIIEATNLVVKNKFELTGSVDIDGPVTASTALIKGNLNVVGSITASAIYTLIESSSIIYSSGSNILGDSTADIQTLNGKVIVSGSEEITGSLQVSNDISSSTLNGIGNVTLYSASVSNIFNNLETKSASVDISLAELNSWSASAKVSITNLNSTTASLNTSVSNLNSFTASQLIQNSNLAIWTGSTFVTFSQSVDQRLDAVEAFTGSLVATFVTTASFNTFTASVESYTASTNIRLNNLESTSASVNTSIANINATTASLNTSVTNLNSTTASLNVSVANLNSTTASLNASVTNLNSFTQSYSASVSTSFAGVASRIDTLSSFTASYATTGSNQFSGNQTITGSLTISSSAAIDLNVIGNSTFSGSVRGLVNSLSVASSTASMDCSLGNFFTLTLPSSTTTRLVATNIQPGETITLKINQSSPSGSITYPSYFKFPNALAYSASAVANSTDILTFVTYDSTNLWGVATKNLV
jgi:uncharacterized coiled-coil protein SlyX